MQNNTQESWEEEFLKTFFISNMKTGTHINAHYEAVQFIKELLASAREEATALARKEERENLVPYIKKLRRYVNGSSPMAMNAIYIPPAQAMRNCADEIEEKDKLIEEVDALLADLSANINR